MEASVVANTPAPEEARRASSSFSIAEWCQHRGISISFFYILAKQGKAPATMKLGRRRMVSAEADAAWARANETATAA
jgi:predicted DNA-binding transcriptional regulator AlpA